MKIIFILILSIASIPNCLCQTAEEYNKSGREKYDKELGSFTADFTEAIGDLNKAISMKPDYAEAYKNRGLVKMQWDFKGAISDYSKTLGINSKDDNAYLSRDSVN